MVSREKFIKSSLALVPGLVLLPGIVKISSAGNFPPLPSDVVSEFVAKAHNDMVTVEKLLKEYPALINAAWDWGNGDFETGIGAASHVADYDLIKLFMDKGAQVNFLTLCVLGEYDLVKKMLELYPHFLNMRGPHGFTPLHHANKGEEKSIKVKELLQKLGAVETKLK